MLFSKPTKAISVDVGSHSVKAIQMSKAGGRLRVDGAGCSLVDRNEFNIDPTQAQARAVREALRRISPSQSVFVGALPAQTVVIRYPRFREMSDAELDRAVQAEAGQNIPYELADVFLDWVKLETVTEGEENAVKVLLVAARHEDIDNRLMVADEANLQYTVLGVDSLALADAAEGCDFLRVGESVAIVNLGASSTSIHFIKDGVSNFIRDVNWGARELVQTISRARHCEEPEAERLLVGAGAGPEPAAVPGLEAVPEAVPEALPDVPQEPPPVPGSGSLLDPLDEELGGLDEPVATPPPIPDVAEVAPAPVEQDIMQVLSTPLGRLTSEIRRSFDYYEQQLYEQPVERLILSGGVAHIPAIRTRLSEELGLEAEVADPSSSALQVGNDAAVADFLEHPAKFMIAIGLAARGVEEL